MSREQKYAVEDALTEETWWNRYGDLHDCIWHYNERLTEIVRGEYLSDMEQFLFKPDGKVLEFGCGTGWVGLRLAQKGMSLEGIDISNKQILHAREEAKRMGVTNARFYHGGVEQIPTETQYDGIVLHALLHHLSDDEIQTLFERLAKSLQLGGRIYAYEPVAAHVNPPVTAWMLDKATLLILRLLRGLVFSLRIQKPEIRRAIQKGWRMRSPKESPINLDDMESLLPKSFEIIDITYWNMLAVAYANICMELKPFWRGMLSKFTPIFVQMDRIILRGPQCVYLKAWPMAGIKILAT
jgi:2-polyprenyl-3-methyl-5-hydroxy-6-metoxy-1,4-benzoquinol methylase